MNKLKDYTGQVFGHLTALSFEKRQKGHTYWKFRCSCGGETVRPVGNLYANSRCDKCKRGTKSHAWQGVGDIPKDIYTATRHNAKSRNLEFDLSLKEMWEVFERQQGKCALTGWDIALHESYATKSQRTASLDRIDPTKGYVSGNIQWVHRVVNYAKRNLTDAEFIKLCNAVTERNKHD